ncbi:hypothetical protein AXG93_872s1000 [Marchantia polymorpha subsp. ruderalis]|uniref:Uncharacterized protein n=1 Tax=Marchantia polymorpha subsp. ruderalis TaxID=1480154 RepID=A0A176VLE7_MARPO|nr:hypothetical protein AXG93_872s1000 [Marchantia polymorpha subsp. ruderalis]
MSSQWFNEGVEEIEHLWKSALPGTPFFSKLQRMTRTVRASSATTAISALHLSTRIQLTDSQGLKDMMINYYRELYNAKGTSLEAQLAKDTQIGMIPTFFTDQFYPGILKILSASLKLENYSRH